MSSCILELDNVYFTYPDGTPALRGVSFNVPFQDKVALIGPNGAGKTTLLLHLNGIHKPQQGAVRYKGHQIRYSRSEISLLRGQVGIVFQDPELQLLGGTVYQDVSFGPANLKLPDDQIHQRVQQALGFTGLTNLADRPVYSLSYGQKKLTAIAGILAMEPRVIALDEPTASLDPAAASGLMDLLDSLNAQGTTVIISTHDVDLAVAWAKQLVIMDDGTVRLTGSPEEVYNNMEAVRSLNLNIPFVVEVFWQLLKTGLARDDQEMPRTRRELLEIISRQRQ